MNRRTYLSAPDNEGERSDNGELVRGERSGAKESVRRWHVDQQRGEGE